MLFWIFHSSCHHEKQKTQAGRGHIYSEHGALLQVRGLQRRLTCAVQAHPVFQENISKNLAIEYQQMNAAHASD